MIHTKVIIKDADHSDDDKLLSNRTLKVVKIKYEKQSFPFSAGVVLESHDAPLPLRAKSQGLFSSHSLHMKLHVMSHWGFVAFV
jgi:hypothetical protein